MKCILIGCVKSSEVFLKKMISMKVNIVGVITKKKSDYNSDFVDLSYLCLENNIDVLYCENVNDCYVLDFIKQREIDVIFCFGWSQLLSADILEAAKYGGIGFHPAALPKNRGHHPIIWALALGLERTSSSFFLMDCSADTGKLLSVKDVVIDYKDDACSLYNKILNIAVYQLQELLENFVVMYENATVQNLQEGNTWRKRSVEDGRIDWRMSSKSIYNLVRALTKPYPGAHFVYKNQIIKVWKVKEVISKDYTNIEPGKVLHSTVQGTFIVKTGDNLIEVLDYDNCIIEEGNYL